MTHAKVVGSVIPGRRAAPSPESIPPLAHGLFVYLLASKKYGTLYIGVTNDIVRRIHEHKSKVVAGFSKRYSVDRLVWFEIYDDPITAIEREKDLKKWRKGLEDPAHRRAKSRVD
jgi:putative endonuclease